MPAWLTSSIELVVGLVCLVAGRAAWSRLRSATAASLFLVAGAAAAGHAAWMFATR
jgi:hypothetical protein